MTDEPLDLDKHRGMAARKATDIRRALATIESNARNLRDRQAVVEEQLLTVSAVSWEEAAAKARYVLNLYAAALAQRMRIIAIWWPPCSRTLPGSRARAERAVDRYRRSSGRRTASRVRIDRAPI